ncbi:hypothetical protein LV779_35760 [Streptomyces thinghirensis]|nr:hypothetical protein [Streptomyces thinghirensis]
MLAALHHDPAEIRREGDAGRVTGTPLPCLQVIDEAHRRPSVSPTSAQRLNHGDTTGALAVVEALLSGPAARLRVTAPCATNSEGRRAAADRVRDVQRGPRRRADPVRGTSVGPSPFPRRPLHPRHSNT